MEPTKSIWRLLIHLQLSDIRKVLIRQNFRENLFWNLIVKGLVDFTIEVRRDHIRLLHHFVILQFLELLILLVIVDFFFDNIEQLTVLNAFAGQELVFGVFTLFQVVDISFKVVFPRVAVALSFFVHSFNLEIEVLRYFTFSMLAINVVDVLINILHNFLNNGVENPFGPIDVDVIVLGIDLIVLNVDIVLGRRPLFVSLLEFGFLKFLFDLIVQHFFDPVFPFRSHVVNLWNRLESVFALIYVVHINCI